VNSATNHPAPAPERGIRALRYLISGTIARLTARPQLRTFRPPARQVWYVRRPGYGRVGPVSMGQIKRGMAAGRIPADCEIQHVSWPYWRPLWAIEEALRIRESRRRQAA
jgi:hypothetical protein